MNDEKIVSIKLSKRKYTSGDQIIHTLCKIGSPLKFGQPFLISGNFKTLRKVLLNHSECIEI